MNVHVDLDIADFVAGRLTEERRKEIEDHLRKCDTCAAEAAWTHDFRNQALRQGLRHLDPMRIVELSTRGALANEAEQEHLASCDNCRAEVAWAESSSIPDVEAEDDEPPARRQRLRLAWIAAAAAIVITVLLVPWGDRLDPTQFAIVEPIPVRTTRSTAEPGSFEENRLLGLEAYASGEYGSAREEFLQALSKKSDRPELLLYLGSAELLEDDLEPAVAHLSQAARLAAAGALRDEADWQLANTLLLLRRTDEANSLLATLADREGPRRDDSIELLERLAE